MAYALLESKNKTNETNVCVFEREDRLGGKIFDFNFKQAPDVAVGKSVKPILTNFIFVTTAYPADGKCHLLKQCVEPLARLLVQTLSVLGNTRKHFSSTNTLRSHKVDEDIYPGVILRVFLLKSWM